MESTFSRAPKTFILSVSMAEKSYDQYEDNIEGTCRTCIGDEYFGIFQAFRGIDRDRFVEDKT